MIKRRLKEPKEVNEDTRSNKKLIVKENKKIDCQETLNNLRHNMTLIWFLTHSLSLKVPVLRSTYCVSHNFMLMIKLSLHLLCLASLVHLPAVQSLIMTIIELTDLILTIYHFLKNKHLRSVIDLLSTILKTLFPFIFLVICLYISFKYGSQALFINKGLQEFGILVIKIGVLVEYLVLFAKLLLSLCAWIKNVSAGKKRQKRAKVDDLVGDLTRLEVVDRVEILRTEGPICYRTVKSVVLDKRIEISPSEVETPKHDNKRKSLRWKRKSFLQNYNLAKVSKSKRKSRLSGFWISSRREQRNLKK